MKLFLSYHFSEEKIFHKISYFLNKQPGIEAFCWDGADPNKQDWIKIVGDVLRVSDAFVFFVSNKIGQTQKDELRVFVEQKKREEAKNIKSASLVFRLSDAPQKLKKGSIFHKCMNTLGREIEEWDGLPLIPAFPSQGCAKGKFGDALKNWEEVAKKCAEKILGHFSKNSWMATDDLPIGYPFDYEKKIIQEYFKGDGLLTNPKAIQQGCSIQWPCVESFKSDKIRSNPIPKSVTGPRRPNASEIIVDVRSEYHHLTKGPGDSLNPDKCMLKSKLTFLEAGPREALHYPKPESALLKVGIVVSGGIAPGINAVIAGICQRHREYRKYWNDIEDNQDYSLEFVMYEDGFSGIMQQQGHKKDPLAETLMNNLISEQRNLGGSMIRTSRYDDLLDVRDPKIRQDAMDQIIQQICKRDGINILYVIGGEGTMRAAHAMSHYATRSKHKLSVVAIPKTMDNDILWVWQSFGFLSAVEKAKEFIMQLHTETKSNPRLCVVQLFGSDSGFVVNHTALGTGLCQAVLIPEVSYTMRSLSREIRDRVWNYSGGGEKQNAHGIILLAETAVPSDVEDYLDNPQYEELNLEESEKSEIRRFVGSSLFCYDELWWMKPPEDKEEKDYKMLMKKYDEWKAIASKEWEQLRNDVKKQSEIDAGNQPLSDLKKTMDNIDIAALGLRHFKSSVLMALNSHIKVQDPFFLDKNQGNVEISQLKSVISELKAWKDREAAGEIVLEAYVNMISARLRSYPLQHEAREIIERLALAQMESPNVAADVDRNELFLRLENLMEQHRKRLLLEAAYPNLILKREQRFRNERRVFGQTPDKLRTGVLKIVSRVLEADIRSLRDKAKNRKIKNYWKGFRVFNNEPRHIIRAIAPSVQDIIFGQRLGILSVDNAMAGYTDFMVSQWLTEYVLVPLKLVVLGRKRVPPTGIFWKSVLASTKQEEDMW